MSAPTTEAEQVNAARLGTLIDRFAELTEPGPGTTRLAFTELERQAHALFAAELAGLGASVRTDAAGNTIADLPPTVLGAGRAIGTGSHLDTVPGGGRFDGIAGVCAGMEVARIAAVSGIPRNRPWRFVVFAGEEGARFGQACNGSRMIAGLTISADLSRLVDREGVTLRDAMLALGLRPDDLEADRWSPDDWDAFVELHIEQGNVLETTRTPIGIVDSISGSSRMRVRISGRATHTGSTPMRLRNDALAAAAECVLACEAIAIDARHHGTRVTVGTLDVHPNSITTIPGRVDLAIDIRDFDSGRQRNTGDELLRTFEDIARRRAVGLVAEVIADTSPVFLHARLVDVLVAAAVGENEPYKVMPSGASHDSQQVSHVFPVAMIFVPSRGGLSHVPEEWTGIDELATGTRVLLAAMRALDGAPE